MPSGLSQSHQEIAGQFQWERKASPRPVGLSPGGRGGGWGYQHHSAPDSGAESEFSGHNLKASRAKQQVFSGVYTDTGASE